MTIDGTINTMKIDAWPLSSFGGGGGGGRGGGGGWM